jgi:hypothetical protein
MTDEHLPLHEGFAFAAQVGRLSSLDLYRIIAAGFRDAAKAAETDDEAEGVLSTNVFLFGMALLPKPLREALGEALEDGFREKMPAWMLELAP